MSGAAYQKKWKRENREKLQRYFRERLERRKRFLAIIKETCGCIDCGTTEGRLDFDHRDGEEKLFMVSVGSNRSLRSVIAEINKCDVRCASCHTRSHWRRGKKPPRQDCHGFVRETFVSDLVEASG